MSQEILTLKTKKCSICNFILILEEGKKYINCSKCGATFYNPEIVEYPKFYIPHKLNEEKVIDITYKHLNKFFLAYKLIKRLKLQDVILVYLPFWQFSGKGIGWILGNKVKHDTMKGRVVELEMVKETFLRDLYYELPGCEISEFGISRIDVWGQQLEHFNEVVAQLIRKSGACIFEITTSEKQILADSTKALAVWMERQSRCSEIITSKFTIIGQRLSLAYYPVWIVRYVYQRKVYTIVIDGVEGNVLHGIAPGNGFLRVLTLIGSIFIAVYLMVGPMMFKFEVVNFVLLLLLVIFASGAVFLIFLGRSIFNFLREITFSDIYGYFQKRA